MVRSRVAGIKCEYFNCYNSYKLCPGTAFHRFPVKFPDILRQWLVNCGNASLDALPLEKIGNRRICSDHFAPDSYRRYCKRKVLSQVAVPFHYQDVTSTVQGNTSLEAMRKRPCNPYFSSVMCKCDCKRKLHSQVAAPFYDQRNLQNTSRAQDEQIKEEVNETAEDVHDQVDIEETKIDIIGGCQPTEIDNYPSKQVQSSAICTDATEEDVKGTEETVDSKVGVLEQLESSESIDIVPNHPCMNSTQQEVLGAGDDVRCRTIEDTEYSKPSRTENYFHYPNEDVDDLTREVNCVPSSLAGSTAASTSTQYLQPRTVPKPPNSLQCLQPPYATGPWAYITEAKGRLQCGVCGDAERILGASEHLTTSGISSKLRKQRIAVPRPLIRPTTSTRDMKSTQFSSQPRPMPSYPSKSFQYLKPTNTWPTIASYTYATGEGITEEERHITNRKEVSKHLPALETIDVARKPRQAAPEEEFIEADNDDLVHWTSSEMNVDSMSRGGGLPRPPKPRSSTTPTRGANSTQNMQPTPNGPTIYNSTLPRPAQYSQCCMNNPDNLSKARDMKKSMNRKMAYLRQNISRKKARLVKLKNEISRLKKIPAIPYNKLSDASRTIIEMQVKRAKGAVREWSQGEKKFAVGLYRKSRFCYKYLRRIGVVLPGDKTVRNWEKAARDAAL